MVRHAMVALAVLAGLGASLLLTSGPTVVVDGETRRCPGVLVTAEARAGMPDRDGTARAGACEQVQTRWTWYAAGLGLLALVAGSGAAFYRTDSEARVAAEARRGSPSRV